LQEKIDLLKKIYSAISVAAELGNRKSDEIKLIAVSKRKPSSDILEMRRAGIRDFGENYVQELVEKIEELKDQDIMWHFIGHLQKNKVKYIIDHVYMIHTLDSLSLAKQIQTQAERRNISKVRVLIQVNIGLEEQKSGVIPSELIHFYKSLLQFDRIQVRGLMTIPPKGDSESARKYFNDLRHLKEVVISETGSDRSVFKDLSMGMSADFDVAIEQGSTMIRIGTMLFGERKL